MELRVWKYGRRTSSVARRTAGHGSRPAVCGPRNPGFTLIEVVIVLFIMGVASGIVGIMISKSTDSLDLRTFTKDVSSVLRYSRNHAVSEKKIYCFVIDRNEHMLRLYSEDTDYKNVKLVLSREIPDSFQMNLAGSEEEAPHIEFFPHGNSTGGLIEIANRERNYFYIAVNRITGRIEVAKGE